MSISDELERMTENCLTAIDNHAKAEEELTAARAAIAALTKEVEELRAGVGEARPAEPPTMYEVIWEWLAENNPAALELCPYKVKR